MNVVVYRSDDFTCLYYNSFNLTGNLFFIHNACTALPNDNCMLHGLNKSAAFLFFLLTCILHPSEQKMKRYFTEHVLTDDRKLRGNFHTQLGLNTLYVGLWHSLQHSRWWE